MCREITDNLIELLIQIIHRIGVRAERKVEKELINDFRRVNGKNNILFQMADAAAGNHAESYHDLLYIKRKFINKDNLHNAISVVVNAILKSRVQDIWGEGTTTCASDSKKFGAWDQNLMTEWHIRYRGRGVMIYWHVEKNSTCIYSQLKQCSSSEVSAMIEGLFKHCTDMEIEKNFVDSHGQSEVAFAFCHLLGFNLMPRIKAMHSQKLYRPDKGISEAFPNLQPVLTRAINWDIIRQQYEQMVKYATALRLGTAETEAILKRFTRNILKHPTYRKRQICWCIDNSTWSLVLFTGGLNFWAPR